MVVVYIALGVLLIMIALAIALSIFLAKPKTMTYEEGKAYLEKIGTYFDYDEREKEEYVIKARDGYELHARFIKNPTPTKRYVIMLHGFTGNQVAIATYIPTFINLGFNVITYDQRFHGINEKKKTICSFAKKETLDFIDVVLDTYERYGESIYLGAFGESMGAGTVVNSLKYNLNLKFVIADSPYQSLKRTIYDKFREWHIPTFLLSLTPIASKIIFRGYNPFKNITNERMNQTRIPLLLIHGLKDQIIKHYQSETIFNDYMGYKELYLVPNALHTYNLKENPVEYEKKLDSFLKNII